MSSGSDDGRRGRAPDPGASFIVGGGETGALIRSMDWAATRLGPATLWPQSLRTTLGVCIASRFPTAIYWGPEFVMLYNDSLLPMVGANKHPQAMGRPAFEVLPEIRQIIEPIEPLFEHVRTTGEATWSEDLMLPLVRADPAGGVAHGDLSSCGGIPPPLGARRRTRAMSPRLTRRAGGPSRTRRPTNRTRQAGSSRAVRAG